MTYIEAFSTALPVILLVALGNLLARLRFFSPGTADDLKKLVVNLTLPLLLFNAFATMAFEPRFLVIVGLVFLACLVVMLAARLIRPAIAIPSPYFPFMMTGFEAGMMGYAIFGALYGLEAIGAFAIIDLGQVLFVFLVLVPALQRSQADRLAIGDTLLSFLKTPVIVAILLGVVFNFTGFYTLMMSWAVTAGVIQATNIMGAITMPLVALVLGYELRLQTRNLLRPLQTIGVRLLFWVPLGLLFNWLVIDRLLGLPPIFQAAVMMMFILPPPFVVPLFMRTSTDEDRNYVLNSLSLATLVTLVAVIVVRTVYGGQ
jgi:malate permease and related proteins